MTTAQTVEELRNQFPKASIEETHIHDETTLNISKEHLKAILSVLKNKGYEVLMDLTAVDYIKPHMRTKVLYWLHNPTTYERVRVTIFVERNESLPSVTEIWAGANWYERELYDMFGVHFEGHPELKRILMPDEWIGHPMRRDYSLTEQPVEFKHGVKPKVPSEIIPYVKIKQKYV